MELIDQHTKKIMEECKVRARAAGLKFGDETLEYIVTNRDMIKLGPKNMVPTLYDYWMNDVRVLEGQGRYKLYPHNPYETVINSRPGISFYNDNNPDWLNTMIFYHVLGHLDCMQNNQLFKRTWNDDFVGQALADKRLIAKLRNEKGRWVDYAIESARGLDNIVGFFKDLKGEDVPEYQQMPEKVEFYFETFLQGRLRVPHHKFLEEVERYNRVKSEKGDLADSMFFAEVRKKHPEFQSLFKKHKKEGKRKAIDILEFIIDNSPKLKKEKNKWMTSVMHVVRNTGMFFGPMRRSKIINEGWASYWHDELFRQDERMSCHEVAYAKLNAQVIALSRIGLNPYAIGSRLIRHVEELADKGKLGFDFQKIRDIETRKHYDRKTGKGKDAIFRVRENFSDFTLINTFVDQDFVDGNNLFVVGQRINWDKGVVEFYVKSRKAEDYKRMLLDSLYHPPDIQVDKGKTHDSNLYLVHNFEGKQLVKDFIPNTMLGAEFLWGGQVQLETTEILVSEDNLGYLNTPLGSITVTDEDQAEEKFEYRRVLYTMKDGKISKKVGPSIDNPHTR